MEVGEIQVGKCYVTATKQVRRVLELTGEGKVKYEARGRRATNGTWPTRPLDHALPSIEDFASSVEKEVRCDYDPDYDTGAKT